MDTSETYIKMCDYEDIRKIAVERVKRDNGWLCTSAVGSMVNAIAKDGEVFTFINTNYTDVWLPTQAQLQEMVGYSASTLMMLFPDWMKKAHPIHKDAKSQLSLTMEQLWLAFVMKEKYNKVWDGENWKNI